MQCAGFAAWVFLRRIDLSQSGRVFIGSTDQNDVLDLMDVKYIENIYMCDNVIFTPK